MKKILLTAAAAALIFGLTGCENPVSGDPNPAVMESIEIDDSNQPTGVLINDNGTADNFDDDIYTVELGVTSGVDDSCILEVLIWYDNGAVNTVTSADVSGMVFSSSPASDNNGPVFSNGTVGGTAVPAYHDRDDAEAAIAVNIYNYSVTVDYDGFSNTRYFRIYRIDPSVPNTTN